MRLKTNYTRANESTSELELQLLENFWDIVSDSYIWILLGRSSSEPTRNCRFYP